MSKVSLLVSAYYAKDFLDRRLTNIFGAKKVDKEIIVVCQGGSIEDDIASKYNVKMIRTPDIPPIGRAWNLGIQAAEGDYLITANTDDRFNIGGLEAMVEILDNHPEAGLVFSQVDIDDGKYQYPWKRIVSSTGFIDNIFEVLQQRCIIGPMPLWRRSIHAEIGWFDDEYIVACDYDMWLRMASHGIKFYYYDESCGVYARRYDSLEHRHPVETAEESKQIKERWA